MIFYFSGTGNSQYAAMQIARHTGDELVSINQCLKENRRGEYQSERPLVFVAPTYAWRMPRVVERWIREARFQGSRDAYFVLTCGGGCGNAAAYARGLCKEKGLRFCGLAPVVMPENYLAMFHTPSEAECRSILAAAEPRIAALAEAVQAGAPFPPSAVSLADRLESGPVNPLFYAFSVRDRGFSASNGCVSCGKCALRCPLNNIAMEDGRPVWKGNCTHCMACIGGCPAQAIEYKAKSRGQHRHYIMKES